MLTVCVLAGVGAVRTSTCRGPQAVATARATTSSETLGRALIWERLLGMDGDCDACALHVPCMCLGSLARHMRASRDRLMRLPIEQIRRHPPVPRIHRLGVADEHRVGVGAAQKRL